MMQAAERRPRRARPIEAVLDREQAEALHARSTDCPRSFRLPVVLCYFEGLTLDEAAQRLRWPARHAPQPPGPGAREAPPRPDPPRRRPARRRPGRRPGTPIGLGVRLTPLCDTTTRAAIAFAAGHAAAALAQEVLRSMLLHKLKFSSP